MVVVAPLPQGHGQAAGAFHQKRVAALGRRLDAGHALGKGKGIEHETRRGGRLGRRVERQRVARPKPGLPGHPGRVVVFGIASGHGFDVAHPQALAQEFLGEKGRKHRLADAGSGSGDEIALHPSTASTASRAMSVSLSISSSVIT